jgi:hypothetical protein
MVSFSSVGKVFDMDFSTKLSKDIPDDTWQYLMILNDASSD